MGLSDRKTIKLTKHLKLNVSSGGVSLTVHNKGTRDKVSKKGIRTSASKNGFRYTKMHPFKQKSNKGSHK